MNRNKPGRPWLNAECEYGLKTALLPCVKNTLFNGLNYFIILHLEDKNLLCEAQEVNKI